MLPTDHSYFNGFALVIRHFTLSFVASLMSSLAHTRAGITDAMYTVGAIEILIDCLNSDNEQVTETL